MTSKQPESEQPEQTSPLETPPPKVTRFSRRMLAVLAVIVSAVITIAVVAGFSPKKTAQGEEAKAGTEEAKNQMSPILPDPVNSMPGTYREAKLKAASQPASPQTAGSAAAGPTADTAIAAEIAQQPVAPAYTLRSPGQAPEDLIQKDRASAIDSPVTFGQNEVPQQARAEEPRPGLVMPPLTALLPPGERPPAADDQNMQGEKRDFSRERQVDLPYIKTTLMAPISQYEIKAGTILPATLITGINSDLPGQIVAQLRENVYDTVTGNYLLVPQGTRLIGEYDSKIAFGQERVLVVWTRLIMPNGSSVTLEGMPGIDLSGYAGVTGDVNNHYGKLVTGVVLGSVIGAGAQVAVGGQGAPNVPPSFGQLAVSGAAQNINQTAQRHTDKVLNLQPTIEVAPGDKINVFVTKDMILKPFTE